MTKDEFLKGHVTRLVDFGGYTTLLVCSCQWEVVDPMSEGFQSEYDEEFEKHINTVLEKAGFK